MKNNTENTQNATVALEKYQENYSQSSFWRKISKVGLRAGHDLIEKALTLFYSAKDKDTPKWARGIIYGTLGYFITPLDLLPDVTPIAGFTDDFGAILAAFTIVAIHIKDSHKQLAHEKMERWFPFIK